MRSVDQLIRPHLKGLKPYSSARDENAGKKGILLDANENPHGSVAGEHWNRYPDPQHRSLKGAISGIKGVPVEKIFLGNGSDEPIDLLFRLFCEPGVDHVLTFPPTYGMYRVAADIHNVKVEEVPLTADFQLDVENSLEKVAQHPKLIFICSPNNPSGNRLDRDSILKIVRASEGIVVVDEAYIDFCPEESLVRYIDHFPNLVVLHTFSKAWGLAAFRLGIAFSQPEINEYLHKIKPPYNLSGIVQQKALSSLLNFQKKELWVKEIIAERDRLKEEVSSYHFIQKVYPSDANFLLVKFDDPQAALQVFSDEKIVVRDRSNVPGCEGCLRITVGTKEENDHVLTALSALS